MGDAAVVRKKEISNESSHAGPWPGTTETVTGAVISILAPAALSPLMYLKRLQKPDATALSYDVPLTVVDTQ